MRTCAVLAALAALLAAAPGQAQFTVFSSIQIEPAEPAAGDTVTATVHGLMQDACWSVLGHACAEMVDRELVIRVDTYDCADRECGSCLVVPVPIEVSCAYVFAEAGSYVLRAVENADTLRGGFHYDFERTIEVAELVPVRPSSWGAVKSLYRGWGGRPLALGR